ncbi:hypothetical protein ACRRTK_008188 [Alexandromys fortis]
MEAACLTGVDLDRLASGLHRHVQVGLALSVHQHGQVDVVVLVAYSMQRIAVVEHLRVGLELQVVFCEL